MPSRRGRCEEQLSGEGGGILFSFFFLRRRRKCLCFARARGGGVSRANFWRRRQGSAGRGWVGGAAASQARAQQEADVWGRRSVRPYVSVVVRELR
jgi:hypothetical protein